MTRPPGTPDADAIAERLGRIAAEAGALLASVSDRGAGRTLKPDGSSVTRADRDSEALILSRLREGWPEIAVVAEESGGEARPGQPFFLVDPLDGTRDFLSGTGEYSVNIALIDGDRPVAAAVASPAEGRVFVAGDTARWARNAGAGAFRWEPLRSRPAPPEGLVALVSRRHGDEDTERLLRELPVSARRTVSSAVKFCVVAAGEADLYLRCGPTMEWDTAAGDHVLLRAGGRVVVSGGRPLLYGRQGRGFRNGAFAAVGDPSLALAVPLPAHPGISGGPAPR